MTAAQARIALGAAAIVRPSTAASWLPFAEADAMQWLRDRDLIHPLYLGDRAIEVVHWGEVIEELRGVRQKSTPPAAVLGLGSLPWADPDAG